MRNVRIIADVIMSGSGPVEAFAADRYLIHGRAQLIYAESLSSPEVFSKVDAQSAKKSHPEIEGIATTVRRS